MAANFTLPPPSPADLARLQAAAAQLSAPSTKTEEVQQATDAKVASLNTATAQEAVAILAPPPPAAALPAQKVIAATNLGELRTDILRVVDLCGNLDNAKKAGEEFPWKEFTAVSQLGDDAQASLTALVVQGLRGNKLKDAGKVGQIMNEMSQQLKGFDTTVQNYGNKIGQFFHMVKDPIESAITKFMEDRTELLTKFTKLTGQLSQYAADALADAASTEAERSATVQTIMNLEYSVAIGVSAMQHVQSLIEGPDGLQAKYDSNKQDVNAQNDLNDAKSFVTRMNAHVDDLCKVRLSSIQGLIVDDSYRDECLASYDNISTMKNLLVPTFMKITEQAILRARQDQRKGYENSMRDTGDALIRQRGEAALQAAQGLEADAGKGIMTVDALGDATANLIKAAEVRAQAQLTAVTRVQAGEDRLSALGKDLAASRVAAA